MAFNYLLNKNMDPYEATAIVGAIENHEEEYGEAVNHIAAALILADKSDVSYSKTKAFTELILKKPSIKGGGK